MRFFLYIRPFYIFLINLTSIYSYTGPSKYDQSLFHTKGEALLFLITRYIYRQSLTPFSQSNTMFIIFQKLLLLFLLTLLVSGGDNNETMVICSRKIPASKNQEKQQGKVAHHQLEAGRVKNAFDEFFSSKRRVPNESDPLHNR